MRYIFGVILISFIMLGCSATRKTIDYYNACKSDPVCTEKMSTVGNMTAASVARTASAVPSTAPYADMLGVIVGSVVAYAVGVVNGKKIKRV